jgi:hypothetical protein
MAYMWWSGGLLDAPVWQVPFFLFRILLLLGSSIVQSWALVALGWYVLWQASLLLVESVSARVLMSIESVLSHKLLSPIIKGITGIILLISLFLDLLSS